MTQQAPIARSIPAITYSRPGRLLGIIAWWLLRYRFAPLIVFPTILMVVLAVFGEPRVVVSWAGAGAAGLTFFLLVLHEWSHVMLLAFYSRGFASVRLEFVPTTWRAVVAQVRWLFDRMMFGIMASRAAATVAAQDAALPSGGAVRVVTNMLLSGRSRARIALAGVVVPLATWFAVAAVSVSLLRFGGNAVTRVTVIVLVATFVYQIVQPTFSGLVFGDNVYADLGRAAAFVMRGEDVHSLGFRRFTAHVLGRLARMSSTVIADLARSLRACRKQLPALAMERCRPKRSCFSWVYRRNGDGSFSNDVRVLPPLGLGLMKRLTTRLEADEEKQLVGVLHDAAIDSQWMARFAKLKRAYLIDFDGLASRAWELADGRCTVDEIAAVVAQESGVDRDVLEPRLLEFLRDMHRKYLINVTWPYEPVTEYPSLSDVACEFQSFSGMLHRIYGAGWTA